MTAIAKETRTSRYSSGDGDSINAFVEYQVSGTVSQQEAATAARSQLALDYPTGFPVFDSVGPILLVAFEHDTTQPLPHKTNELWRSVWKFQTLDTRSLINPDDFRFSIDIGNHEETIDHSISAQQLTRATGDVENFANGLPIEGPNGEGLKIRRPHINFNKSYPLPNANVDAAFIYTLSEYVGTSNSVAFQGFPKGSLLLHEISGTRNGTGVEFPWQFDISWAIKRGREFQLAVNEGDDETIVTVNLDGWWYFETENRHIFEPDHTRTVIGAYTIHQIYPALDHGTIPGITQ